MLSNATGLTRFPLHYVHVKQGLTSANHKQNPYQTLQSS